MTEKDNTRELGSGKIMEGIRLMNNTGENLIRIWYRVEIEVMDDVVMDIENGSEAVT